MSKALGVPRTAGNREREWQTWTFPGSPLAVDVDEGHRRVCAEVEEVLGAIGAVGDARGASYGSQDGSEVVRVGDVPLVGVVEVGVDVEVGHGEYQPG